MWFCNLRQIPYSFNWEEFWDHGGKFDEADFFRTPRGVTQDVTVRRVDLVRAAEAMDVSRFLPTELERTFCEVYRRGERLIEGCAIVRCDDSGHVLFNWLSLHARL